MKYQVQENCLTIYLPREVDHHNAEEIKAEADAVIDRNHIRYVIFDFDRTDFMDSSGIGIIILVFRFIRLIKILYGYRVSILYMILYLCGLEILPILVLYKLLD